MFSLFQGILTDEVIVKIESAQGCSVISALFQHNPQDKEIELVDQDRVGWLSCLTKGLLL